MKKRHGRISLSAYDAEHVYEWLMMYWHEHAQKFGGCYECERTGRRLERLIGPAAVRQIARAVKKNPGSAGGHRARALTQDFSETLQLRATRDTAFRHGLSTGRCRE